MPSSKEDQVILVEADKIAQQVIQQDTDKLNETIGGSNPALHLSLQRGVIVSEEKYVGSWRISYQSTDEVREGEYAISNKTLLTTNLRSCICLAISGEDKEHKQKVYLAHISHITKQEMLTSSLNEFMDNIIKVTGAYSWIGHEWFYPIPAISTNPKIILSTALEDACARYPILGDIDLKRYPVSRYDTVGLSAAGKPSYTFHEVQKQSIKIQNFWRAYQAKKVATALSEKTTKSTPEKFDVKLAPKPCSAI